MFVLYDVTYGKTSLVKKTNYTEFVGICRIRPIIRKRPKYEQNYAFA